MENTMILGDSAKDCHSPYHNGCYKCENAHADVCKYCGDKEDLSELGACYMCTETRKEEVIEKAEIIKENLNNE